MPLLAFENPFEVFGVTSWEPLVANAIAFIVVAVILKMFAFKPLIKVLDERKQRIAEAEEMRKKTEETLASLEAKTDSILEEARDKGTKLIEEAKDAAERFLHQKEQEAGKQVEDILSKAREASAIEAREARNELRSEFSRLVAQATAQATGKVLSEEDRRAIDDVTLASANE